MCVYSKAKLKALSNNQEYHLAAILKRKNKPVYIGINQDKTHPMAFREYNNKSMAASLHAEMDALRFSKPGDSLEVIRFLKDGDMTMAKPCEFCEPLIKKYNLSSVKYTNWSGSWENLNL